MKKTIPLITFAFLISKSTFSQNTYLLSNKFSKTQFEKLYKKDSDEKYIKTKKINSTLKGYITKFSEDKDTMFVKFWNITNTAKTKDPFANNDSIINSSDNDATFAYKVDWKGINHISVPFSAYTINAVSLPFRYRLKPNADLEADFLNAGVNFLKVWGKTKFYKQEQIAARQNYHGVGFFVAFSQQKIDSANTRGNVTAEHTVAAINYGISLVQSWNNFNITLAIGCDNAIGYSAQHWEENNLKYGFKPWIGFGFGFKLVDIELKQTNSQD